VTILGSALFASKTEYSRQHSSLKHQSARGDHFAPFVKNKDLQNRLCAERTQSGNRGLSIGLVLLFPFLRARLNDEIKRKRCANFMEYKKLQPLPTVS
jgi:hypothetical protein